MAQWEGIDRVATIAQLVGVDALGLISTILQAAQAVHRNRETCLEIVQDVQMIRSLLGMLQDPEMMRQAEIVNALNGLEGTLREAYSLVSSCRDCGVAYRVFMGWKQTDQFRRVKKKIAKHLRLYPMICHADITRRLERLGNSAHLTCSSQDTEGMPSSSTSHSNPQQSFRTEGSLEPVELERFEAGNESIAVEEHQPGHQGIVETLLAKKWRFKWGHRLSWKNVETETNHHIHELIGPGCTIFTYSELQRATNNFSCRQHNPGDVYKGRLRDGLQVAIRGHRGSHWSKQHCENELRLVGKLQHINIMKILGCCTTEKELFLVYELMHNGSLYDHIHGSRDSMLPWSVRFQIVEGIAQGALYLHKHCGLGIIHRDLKPSNILLDDGYIPKIDSFGLSKTLPHSEDVETAVRGTIGFIAPEHLRTGSLSVKNDVFSYGILLLEIISGKRCFDMSAIDVLLLDWVRQLWTAEKLTECIDPRLGCVADESETEEIKRCIHIALLCAESDPERRPTMSDVLRMLSDNKAELPIPSQTAHIAEDSLSGSPDLW